MPGGDKTGPNGMGPLTGRGAGYCSGSDSPGFMDAVRRRIPAAGRTFYRGAGKAFPSRHGGRGHGRGSGRSKTGG